MTNTTKPILGITGKARVGKDTFADILVDHYGFRKISFADPIRFAASHILGIPMDSLIDGPVKEQPLDWLDVTPRQFMQRFGTEFGRQMIDPDIWLKYAQRRINTFLQDTTVNGIVISDVRFDNEAFFVRDQLSGSILQIVRPGSLSVNPHLSEAGLTEYTPDLYLVNDGSLDAFQAVTKTYGFGIACGISIEQQQQTAA